MTSVQGLNVNIVVEQIDVRSNQVNRSEYRLLYVFTARHANQWFLTFIEP